MQSSGSWNSMHPNQHTLNLGKYKTNLSVKLGNVLVPKVETIMYLDLPIDGKETKYDI